MCVTNNNKPGVRHSVVDLTWGRVHRHVDSISAQLNSHDSVKVVWECARQTPAAISIKGQQRPIIQGHSHVAFCRIFIIQL